MGIVEAKMIGSLRHIGTILKEGLRTLHDKAADMGCGRISCLLADKVAEVVGRQEQLLGAVFHGGKTKLVLDVFIVVVPQEVLKPAKGVGVIEAFLVFSMASFNFTIVSGSIRADLFVTDVKAIESFLKQS